MAVSIIRKKAPMTALDEVGLGGSLQPVALPMQIEPEVTLQPSVDGGLPVGSTVVLNNPYSWYTDFQTGDTGVILRDFGRTQDPLARLYMVRLDKPATDKSKVRVPEWMIGSWKP